MNLHKIVLVDYKDKLQTICMVNHKSVQENKHLGQDLIVISQMDNYLKEATKYTKLVKELHSKFVNKNTKDAKDYCIKENINYEIISDE